MIHAAVIHAADSEFVSNALIIVLLLSVVAAGGVGLILAWVQEQGLVP